MGQPAVLAEMAFGKVEQILALFGLVGEVVFGHPPEGGEAQHGQRPRQAGDGAAARLDGPLEELAVDVLHVLEERDYPVLLRRRRDDARHGQHVPPVAGAELHVVDEILQTHPVEDAVRVDEENEEVVVPLQVLLVHLVDELEGRLLAAALPAVGKAGKR